jgi:outer membrane protein insertion porin family
MDAGVVSHFRPRAFASRTAAACLALLALLPASLGAAGEAGLLGRTVVSVSCVADGPFDRDEIARLTAVKAGRPLSDADTAATVGNLYATRRFADVRIEAAPEGDGVAVTVVLFRAFRIRPLAFTGRVPISRAELRKALAFAPDALYSRAAVDQGAGALERRLQAEGFLSARARPAVTFDRRRFDARVTYAIEPGPAALAAEPFFDGDPAPFSAADLASRMRMKPGGRYRESTARADASRMTEFLHGQEHYRALVELIAAQPMEDGRAMPVYRLRVGPRVVFEATGIKPEKLAKELHALAESQTIDEELVLQFVEGRKEALQRSGRYRAAVTYVFDARSDPSVTRIRVDIVEGPKFFVEKVRFEGNVSVPDKALYDLMATRRKGLPLVTRGRLVDSVLAQDAEALLAYYQSRGWIRAKVPAPRVEDGSKPGALTVTVSVEEGPRAFVESRILEGAEHLDLEAAAALLSVKEGATFDPNAVREDVGRLSAWYHDRGWREAAVRDQMALSEDGTKARVTYRVDEGLKSFFGKTIIRGNTRTATARIERLVTWKEGDTVSESKVLETQRGLSRSGVFRRVDVRPQRADPATQSRNVEIEVEEGRPWSLLYGLGYQYTPGGTEGQSQNDPYLAAGVSYNNVLGRMISAGIEAQYAPISRRGRVQAFLREPFLFGTSYPLNFLGFLSRELIGDVELERRGVTLDSYKIVARGLRVGLRYTYQRIKPTNELSYTNEINLPAINRPIHESTIGPDILFDRRDDIIDPHSGYYLSGSFKYAFPFLSADAQFKKFSTQAAGFVPLFGRAVFVVSARVGGIFGDKPGTSTSPGSVPIGERFFAGGRSTERGFDTDLLGIPGQTVDYSTVATRRKDGTHGSCASLYPDRLDLATYDCAAGPHIMGGNGFLALNAELRIPIAGNLGGVVFYDAAQVWSRFSDIRFRFEGASGLRQGAGIGLRYLTPIGPVRVEYGWPLMARTISFEIREPFTDAQGHVTFDVLGHGTTKEKGRLFFSIGYPF